MLKRKSTNSLASVKTMLFVLTFAIMLTPALCCCFGFQSQAMAATSNMEMEDCHGHASTDETSSHHQSSSEDAPDSNSLGCEDCSYATAFNGIKIDRIVAVAPVGFDFNAAIDNTEVATTPTAILVGSIYPRRGPPPLVRTTLVSLRILLLN